MKAAAGVVVTVQQDGRGIEIIAGLVRPEDRKAAKVAADTDVLSTTAAVRKNGELPESLVRRLTAHRTRAIQAVLSQRGDVALALLVCRLALPVFYKGTLGAMCLGMRLERPSLEREADDIAQCAASAALIDRHKQLKHTLPKKARDLFPWLLTQPQDQLIALLGCCLAEGIDTVQSRVTRDEDTEALMLALDIDMADWWQATAASYFKFIKKDDTLAVLKEACAADVAPQCAALKKVELVGAAEAAVRDTRWLPPLLRPVARRKVSRKARQ